MKKFTLLVSLLASVLIGCGEDNKSNNNPGPSGDPVKEAEAKNSLFGYWQNSYGEVVLIDSKKESDSEVISTMIFLPSIIFDMDNSVIVPTKRVTLERNAQGYLEGRLDFEESKSEVIEYVQVAVGNVVDGEVRIGYSIQFRGNQGTGTNEVFKKLNFFEGERLYYEQLQEISPVFAPNYYKKIDHNKGKCANRPTTWAISDYARDLNLDCLTKLLDELPKDEATTNALTDALREHLTDYISPNLEIVKVLVENGASLQAKNEWGSSLFKSLFSGWKSGYFGDVPDGFPAYVETPSIISYLVSNGANLTEKENKDNYSVFYRLMQLGLLDTAREVLAGDDSSDYQNDYGSEYGFTYLYGLFMDYNKKFSTNQTDALKMVETLITEMKVEFSAKAAVELVEHGTPELLALTKNLGWLKVDRSTYNAVKAESDESLRIYKKVLAEYDWIKETERMSYRVTIANIGVNLKWYAAQVK